MYPHYGSKGKEKWILVITQLSMSPSGDRECLPEASCSVFMDWIRRSVGRKMKPPRTMQKRNVNLCTINQDNVYQPKAKVRWELRQVGSKVPEMRDLCVQGMVQEGPKGGRSLCCLLDSC